MQKPLVIVLVLVVGVLLLLPVIAKLAGGKDSSDKVAATSATVSTDGTPAVVQMEPDNGAIQVDPNLTKLTVTFNTPMGGGFSWTGGGPSFPEGAGKPSWSSDGKTCSFPVRLKPNWSYRLGLNSKSHQNFRSTGGIPLTPLIWTFSTGS